MTWRERVRPTPLARDLDAAHRQAVAAATAGMSDAALGATRLGGSGVPLLADAAVTSATPFLRAPLLGRLSGVRRLHPRTGVDGVCPSCRVSAPCATALEVER